MPSSLNAMTVRFADLRDAFEFVSNAAPLQHNAYLCAHTGKIYLVGEDMDLDDDELPDDLDEADRYFQIPHKNDFNLGRELALSFTNQVLPADYEEVSLLFQKRNSYRAFKEWLLSKNQLQNWFQFEALAVKDALHAWCAENSIKLIPERHSSK